MPREAVLDLLTRLVKTNSVNPVLVPGAPGERDIAPLLAQELRSLGCDVQILETEPGRLSVLAFRKGTGGGRSLMLNGHIDTVDVNTMPAPFDARVDAGRLYGRGSYDMKASITAMVTAVKLLGDAPLRGDVVIACVADEEYASIGTEDVLRHIRTDACIVTEPTSLRICLAHKGYAWIDVETSGFAAHGSRFAEGIDANMKMGRFLGRLDTLEQELRARPPHPLIGPPSLHAALLKGGTGLSTYAASSKVTIERRLIPGETREGITREIENIAGDATAKTWFFRDAFEISPETAIVQALDKAAGHPPHYGDTPWMDSALAASAGIETVVFGPHGEGAHGDVEWVDIDSVVHCAEVYAAVAREYCG